MIVRARHKEPIETDSVRIEIKGNEFLLIERADGLHVLEVGDDTITIRPQVANSIVLVTKDTKK